MTKQRKCSKTLEATAYHEAGHHVLKWHFGFSLGPITIKADLENDTLGSSGNYRPLFKAETIQKFMDYETLTPGQWKRIENQIMVCLAGKEAERIFRPKKKGLCGASQDYEHAWLFLNVLVSELSDQFPVYWKLLTLRTRELLSGPNLWCAVEGLAKALLERETLSGKESREVIYQAFADKRAKRK